MWVEKEHPWVFGMLRALRGTWPKQLWLPLFGFLKSRRKGLPTKRGAQKSTLDVSESNPRRAWTRSRPPGFCFSAGFAKRVFFWVLWGGGGGVCRRLGGSCFCWPRVDTIGMMRGLGCMTGLQPETVYVY